MGYKKKMDIYGWGGYILRQYSQSDYEK